MEPRRRPPLQTAPGALGGLSTKESLGDEFLHCVRFLFERREITEENLSSISLPGSDVSMNKVADFVDSQKLKAFMNTSYDPRNTQDMLSQYADYCMNVNPGPTLATPQVPISTTGLFIRSQKRKIDDGSTTQEGLPGAKRQLTSLPMFAEDATNTVRAGSDGKDADVDMQDSAPLLSLDAANANKTTLSSSEKQLESTYDPLPTQEPGRSKENGVAKDVQHPAEPTKKGAQKSPSKTKSSSNDATGAKTDGKAKRTKKTTTGGKTGGKNRSKNTKKEKKDDDDDGASENEFFTFTPGIDQSLPALSDIQDIFDDITSRAYELGFNEAVDLLDGRVINVATMCSGTESPLLALEMIRDALKRVFKKELQFKHLFSAEIVPFKQAYIERNFAPAILFRDMREIAQAKQKGGKAHTAYGALADVPNNVHLLIAGFSCVDLSKLSRWNKKLTDLGESGDTFRSILRYAKEYRPAIIILENVKTANWKFVKAVMQNDQEEVRKLMTADKAEFENVWDDDDPAYACCWINVDTKNYYIPHTRQRVYMFCISRELWRNKDYTGLNLEKIEKKTLATFALKMREFRRPASVSVEAFLLPPDDRRLHHAKDEISKVGSKTRKDVDWALCQGRYEDYRAAQNLGRKRPITRWVNGGSAQSPDYWWSVYVQNQVERLWDTFEISFLRNIVRGFDAQYKTRVWELSQNIDRFKDHTHFGIANCVTPTGQPFLTTRGGPIVGLEVMALQGLPTNKLLLSRETQRELQDLAGNAMTSTVIGIAIICAFIAGHAQLEIATKPEKAKTPLEVLQINEPMDLDHVEGKKIPNTTPPIEDMNLEHLQDEAILDIVGFEPHSLVELHKISKKSSRLCYCEGPHLNTKAPILDCRLCGHHICMKCGSIPQHDYTGRNQTLHKRTTTQKFSEAIKKALPMVVKIFEFGFEDIETLAESARLNSEDNDWSDFKEAITSAFGEELRFQCVKRSYCWTVIFEGASCRLELVFTEGEVFWQLFGKPSPTAPANSTLCQLLKHPIARMVVRESDILQGCWEFRLPMTHTFKITIKGEGRKIRSLESRLGLQADEFADKKTWSHLRITTVSALGATIDCGINGVYELLPRCGTAMGTLHKRISQGQPTDIQGWNEPEKPLYLLFDPERIGHENVDQYVFATNIDRLSYGETRSVIARVSSKWRPTDGAPVTMNCSVSGEWLKCGAKLRASQGLTNATYCVPLPDPITPVSTGIACPGGTIALLSCKVPQAIQYMTGWSRGDWTTVDKVNESQTFTKLTWLTERARDLQGFQDTERPLILPNDTTQCGKCAPTKPDLRWRRAKETQRVTRILAYEDPQQAGEYERALKFRANAFQIRTRIDGQGNGCVQIGINLTTMAHRLLTELKASANEVHGLIWQLYTDYDMPSSYKLDPFTLRDNHEEAQAGYQFPAAPADRERPELRVEQQKSLTWMLLQEDPKTKFTQEEIEETIIPQLNWRAVVRAKKSYPVLGGVLADEVGYGKTATTLALIHKQSDKAPHTASVTRPGLISLKATLVLVPAHLVLQWKEQVDKFLGTELEVLVLAGQGALAKTTLQRFKDADIIIASKNIFGSRSYWSKMGSFASLPDPAVYTGRAFEAWLDRAIADVGEHTKVLQDIQELQRLETIQETRRLSRPQERDLERINGRLKGRLYEQLRCNFKSTLKEKLNSATKAKAQKPDILALVKSLKDALKPKSLSFFATWLKVELERKEKDETLLQGIPTKRLRGAKYVKIVGEAAKASTDEVPKKAEERSYKNLEFKTPAQMKSPCFQMFLYNRLVLDEYTYLNDTEDAAIRKLVTDKRWILSGTPDLGDFHSVHRIAALIGANLGVVDDATGVLRQKTIQSIRNAKTWAEKFQGYINFFTTAWHEEKQKIAQSFLSDFVRQNFAKDIDITVKEHTHAVKLYSGELLLYIELQQLLESNLMKLVLRGSSRAERAIVRRQQSCVEGSKTAEEALLKKCSYDDQCYKLKKSKGSELTVNPTKDLVDRLNRETDQISGELANHLLHAEILNKFLEDAGHLKQDENKPVQRHPKDHYGKWKDSVERGTFGDQETTKKIKELIANAKSMVENGITTEDEEKFYRDPLTKKEIEVEKKALETRKKEVKEEKKKQRTKANNKQKELQKLLKAEATARMKGLDDDRQDDDDNDEEVPEEDEQDVYVEPLDPRGDKFNQKIFADQHEYCAAITTTLRKHIGVLRSFSTELVSRTRAHRFFNTSQNIQLWRTRTGQAVTCDLCKQTPPRSHDILVNTSCGHVTCTTCYTNATHVEHCLLSQLGICEAPAEGYRLKTAEEVGVQAENKGVYGSKLDSIIALINKKIPGDEQVLVFIQFDNLMMKYSKAFKESGISNYALSQTAGGAAVQMLNDFQTNTSEQKVKVLMLNSSNETAAGANLTMANHVIFVGPLLADTQEDYVASRKQCIGRARRFGQKKDVHVYDFVALKTFDVDVYQQRHGTILVRRMVNDKEKFVFVKESEATQAEMQESWGSGYKRLSYEE